MNDLRSIRAKMTDSVLSVVPRQRWVEQADDGGSSIAHLVLHVARHHDLALTTAIRNKPRSSMPTAPPWPLRCSPGGGSARAGGPRVSVVLPLDALVEYFDAVFDATAAWLGDVGTMMFDTVPDTSHRLAHKARLSVDDVDWLHRMWSDQPVSWLVQWPIVGHGQAHVGEAISVRNRMGLSPF